MDCKYSDEQVVQFIGSVVYRRNIKKNGICVFKPMYNMQNGQFLHAYEYLNCVDMFLAEILPNFCFSRQLRDKCMDIIPDVEFDHDIISFQNGLYDYQSQKFFSFTQIENNHMERTDRIAWKHFDLEYSEESKPCQIPVPSIFGTDEIPNDKLI